VDIARHAHIFVPVVVTWSDAAFAMLVVAGVVVVYVPMKRARMTRAFPTTRMRKTVLLLPKKIDWLWIETRKH
jgi:hypothetical protein